MNYKEGFKKSLEETTLAGGGTFGPDSDIGTHGGDIGNSDWYAPGDARNLWGFSGKKNHKKKKMRMKMKSKNESQINNLDFPMIRRTFPETFQESLQEESDPILDCILYTEEESYNNLLVSVLEKNQIEYIVEDGAICLKGTDEYLQEFLQSLYDYLPEKTVAEKITVLIGEFDSSSGKQSIDFYKALKRPKKPLNEYDPVQVAKGTKVEMEHTTDPNIARIIALNHIDEFPDYYIELAKMEKILEQRKQKQR